MKFWRTFAAVALIGLMAAAAFAGQGVPDAKKCWKETKLVPARLAMCKEMNDDTQNSWGNGFPWENSTFFFSTFRNQFMYPSSTVTQMQAITTEINGISARTSSFSGGGVNVYGSFPNGDPSSVSVNDTVGSSMVRTFGLNFGPNQYCAIQGTSASPIRIESMTGPRGSTISTCTTCSDPIEWCLLGDITQYTAGGFMVDHTLSVAPGTSGTGVWDVTSAEFGQGCPEPRRAYGSGSFVNPDHLTTAYGVDYAAFIWVFNGTSPPPPATVEQQIKEIVRLLLTPQGLRCSGLDLNPGNGLAEDTPIQFPHGKDVDPIQPQVANDGAITGDETIDDLRAAGFRAP